MMMVNVFVMVLVKALSFINWTVALVSFTQMEYRVEESIGSLNLLVMITDVDGLMGCTYNMAFWISVISEDGTAG